MSDGVSIHRLDILSPEDVTAVTEMVESAAQVDGFSALNEAAVLQLERPSADVVHLLAVSSDGLLGYAQLQRAEPDQVGSLVVDQRRRGGGVGDALLTRAIGTADGRLRIWATRDTPAAQALGRRHGLVPARRLMIMERALDGEWPPAPPPAGVTIRAFRPGLDEDAWLAVNARAFAYHPEQGRINRADLEQRMGQPWFDPAGFFVAERHASSGPPELVGFHWTKRHPDSVGEVYVLGVDPAAGIRGLGRPLLIAGLDHLRSVGDDGVILYVEGDNEPARRLYERAGFTIKSVDVMYAAAGWS